MTEEGEVAKKWASFREVVLHPETPPAQMQELRRAFYAGATGLLAAIMSMLDPEEEPTDADVARMEAICDELHEFGERVVRGEA